MTSIIIRIIVMLIIKYNSQSDKHETLIFFFFLGFQECLWTATNKLVYKPINAN